MSPEDLKRYTMGPRFTKDVQEIKEFGLDLQKELLEEAVSEPYDVSKALRAYSTHLQGMGYESTTFTVYDGTAGCIVVDNEHGHDVQGVWVAPEHRGKGRARYLIERVQDCYMRLTLTCTKELSAMYMKFGFVVTEEVPINSVRMRWEMKWLP